MGTDITKEEPRGRRQDSPHQDDKNMLGNIGSLFVKYMQQVTKGHSYHPLGVSDYYVMYGQSCETSTNVTITTDHFCEKFEVRGRTFCKSPRV